LKYLVKSTLFLGFTCCFMVSGCASRLPRTVSLEKSVENLAVKRLDDFVHESCVEAMDSDVRVSWQAYGRKVFYTATLQAASPSFIRFAAVDPLNRPLYLLVSTGKDFTFADNIHGEGFTGTGEAEYFKRFLPQGILADELFLWLSGRVKEEGLRLLSVSKAEEGALFWYEVRYDDSLKHLLGLDLKHLRRHLVVDKANRIVLDVQYAGYNATPRDCDWPGTMKVDGEAMEASLSLEVKKVYSYARPDEQIFHLQLPAHYTVHEMR